VSPSCCRRVFALAILLPLFAVVAAPADAQVRTTGQIVGTVRDASGAVVPDADIQIRDLGTGITAETRSARDGGFVFPALQPGRYLLTAVAPGFQPVVIESLAVETSRASNVEIKFELAGIQEQVQVQGRATVIETSSTTISSTIGSEQIETLPVGDRSVLVFALLIPGAQQSGSRTPGTTSPAARNSHINGLPGGAINITLDGVNNNSARFRSGGTSIFTFAPTRLGAMEEVTVSTAGLTADGGAQGAVQIQFVTKRGSNAFHGQIFDQIQNDKLNANTPLNNARGIPKTQLRLHEFGANIGGPVIRNRLFFFGNYEQIHQPGTRSQTRTVLTPEAQQGIFRYAASDGSIRTANLLDIAATNGFPSRLDPTIATQLQLINSTLGAGSLASEDLIRNNLVFQIPTQPLVNVYPTARVDFQATNSLAVRGVLNLHWRDLAQTPQYPGMDFIGGFTSNYYILSTGVDWTPRPNLFNQFTLGGQSNWELFNKTNTNALYEPAGMRRIIGQGSTTNPLSLPLNVSSAYLTGALPLPRNNPVYNVSNTLTWLTGRHSFTFGGTFRRTSMWESSGGEPDFFNLGVAAGDPVSAIFNTTTIPGLRSADQPNVLALYALLTGRISSISGFRNIDEDSKQYGLNPVTRREAHQVGGLYAQDSFRWRPNLTLNYGLRWELTGAAHNTNDIYASPTLEHLKGPSTDPFQPGVLNGVADPQLVLQPHPYKADLFNFAPNVGAAWSPEPRQGFLGGLLGRSVLRGSVGINYYDEGLNGFSAAAGTNPGLTQSVFLNPGMPGFAPGGLTLSSPLPSLATFPADFRFPLAQSPFTFTRGFSTIDPDIKTPSIVNWTLGIQRELWRDAAVEARYVGNAGRNLWRSYNLNEVNVFENGFLDEFKAAQRNLAINLANNQSGFANNRLPGQVPLPIFEAAFGARGSQGALPAASGFTNGTFVTLLQQGQAGRLANAMAANAIYLCRMVGSNLSPCSGLGYTAPGAYPINLFQMNPFAAGSNIRALTDEASSNYHALQMQFRQRYRSGFSVTANYTYGRARTDRYSDSDTSVVDYFTLRDKGLNSGPDVYDVRQSLTSYWLYALPFGADRQFKIGNPVLEQVLGGWELSGILRLQTGRPFLLTSDRWTINQYHSGVVLRGITVKDLQKMVKVSPGPNGNVYFLDKRLIGPDGRANPEFITVPTTPGERGQYLYLYGPRLVDFDLGLTKRFRIVPRVQAHFEALMLTAFNNPSYLVGLVGGATLNIESTTFGQTNTMSAGPRAIVLRFQVSY
jgi:Carboxypeptidase regulatory-like domain